MPQIRLDRVISVSSEHSSFPAANLLSAGGVRSWRSAEIGVAELSVILQLREQRRISAVHIGNDGSAFVQVLVGRRTAASGDEFAALLPAASFMSPKESRDGTPTNRVRIFDEVKLDTTLRAQQWDCVRVVCTQPFNRRTTYGLAFVKLFSNDADTEALSAISSCDATATVRGGSQDSPLAPALQVKPSTTAGDDQHQFRPGALFNKHRQQNVAAASAAGQDSAPKRLLGRSLTELTDTARPPRQVATDGGSNNRAGRSDEGNTVHNNARGGDDAKRRQEKPATPRVKTNKENGHSPRDTARQPPETRRRRRLPLKQLLSGVVFSMSGYQNPRRADLRRTALRLGARYEPDWIPQCTHLVCAFSNTPKMAQAGSGARVVKAEWLEQCARLRRRLPWRRHALLPADKGRPDSDEEVWAEEGVASRAASQQTSSTSTPDDDVVEEDTNDVDVDVSDDDVDYVASGSSSEDTDDEIRAVHNKNAARKRARVIVAPPAKRRPNKNLYTNNKLSEEIVQMEEGPSGVSLGLSVKSPASANNVTATEDTGKLIDPSVVDESTTPKDNLSVEVNVYEQDTDVEESPNLSPATDTRCESSVSSVPELPDFFSGLRFCVDELRTTTSVPEELRRQVDRFVTAFGGHLTSRQEADFIIVADSQANVEAAQSGNSVRPTCVRAAWIFKCNSRQRRVDHQEYTVR